MAFKVDKSESIHQFRKSHTEEVHVDLITNKDKQYINFRVFYMSEFDEYLPGKQGMSLSVSKLDDLEKAVKRLRAKFPKSE